ncbi:hypothetical protein V2S84_19235, partial [Azotobacter chroococcum]|nr:hypothetical protein [Azotobacter chroococcum]
MLLQQSRLFGGHRFETFLDAPTLPLDLLQLDQRLLLLVQTLPLRAQLGFRTALQHRIELRQSQALAIPCGHQRRLPIPLLERSGLLLRHQFGQRRLVALLLASGSADCRTLLPALLELPTPGAEASPQLGMPRLRSQPLLQCLLLPSQDGLLGPGGLGDLPGSLAGLPQPQADFRQSLLALAAD